MLGEKIRKIRKAKDLTLDQLAEKLGSSSGTLSHIEKGSRNPSLDMLTKIAEALEVPVSDLVDGDTQAENMYMEEIDKATYSEKDKFLVKELDAALYGESEASKALKAAQEIYKVDPALFITMCRAKDLPEEDRKMLRDMSAKLLEAHHSKRKNKDNSK